MARDNLPPSEEQRAKPARRSRLSRLAPAIASGLVSGVLVISFDISLAALIFSGPLSHRLAMGIGIFLIGSIIVGVAVALGSSFKPAIAAPQDDAAVITALMAAAIAASLAAINPQIDPFPTIVAAIGVTSLATGAFFLFLGIRRMGILVRFIPYPVVGGFLAGAGWLLVQGSTSVMLGKPIGLKTVHELWVHGAWLKYVPGLAFGAILSFSLRRINNFLLLPGLLVLAIGTFYGIAHIAGLSMAEIGEAGWLLGPLPAGTLWPPMELSRLEEVHWAAIGSNVGNVAAVIIMACITLLLSATSVEVATEQEIDLDRELQATGIGNMLAGLAGGMVSYLTLSESTMNYKTGANTRLTGIISASCCVLVLVFGANTLSYLPLPVLGGMLAYLGFESLIDTVFEDWFRLRRLEYLVIMLILLVIAFYGFLEGVAVGLVFSVILFAASYSRIEVIRNAISGVDLRSNVGRTAGEDYILDQRGRQIYILQLQGYIFFGTAYRLLMRAQLRILSREPAPLRYLVLDCRHVNGIDSSAVASFQRLRRMSENQGVKLIFTEIPRDVETHLTRARVIRDQDDPIVTVYKDIDHGLESCENGLIEDAPTMTTAPPVLSRDLEAVFHNPSEVVRFLGYLKRVELPKGADLFRQGDASKDLFIVESGEVTAWLEIDGEKKKRLRTMGPGTVVGESGLYLDASRSATVVASSPTVLYQLSMEALEEMTQRAPDLAASFHKFVARLLAQRMVNTTNAVKALFN